MDTKQNAFNNGNNITRSLLTLALLLYSTLGLHTTVADTNNIHSAFKKYNHANILISGIVYSNKKVDSVLTDTLLAELARGKNIQVLERVDIEQNFKELSINTLTEDILVQVQLGHLLGVNTFVFVEVTPQIIYIDIVDAQTGRTIRSFQQECDSKKFLSALPALCDKILKSTTIKPPPTGTKTPSLGIIINQEAQDSSIIPLKNLETKLSEKLIDKGILVLNRKFARDVVNERWLQEKGIVKKVGNDTGMKGADFLLEINAGKKHNAFLLTIIEVKTGRRFGNNEFLITDITPEVMKWIIDRLIVKPKDNKPKASKNITIAETLAPFYRGLSCYNKGEYTEAIEELYHAKDADINIPNIKEWIKSSIDNSGFQEISEEVLSKQNWNTKQGSTTNTNDTKSGILLLSETASPDISKNTVLQLNNILISSLYNLSKSTIMVQHDIAALCSEFDLLVGLDNKQGTTWKEAPTFIPNNIIKPYIEKNKKGFSLQLTLVKNCSHEQIYSNITQLPENSSKWSEIISTLTKELFDNKRTYHAPLTHKYTESELISFLISKFSLFDYLRLLSQNPTIPIFTPEIGKEHVANRIWQFPLAKWLFSYMPLDHVERPWLDGFVTMGDPDGSRKKGQITDKYTKLVEKYPHHSVGLLAQFNIIMDRLNDENIVEAADTINVIFQQLNDLNDAKCSAKLKKEIYETANTLRFALGAPNPQNDNILIVRVNFLPAGPAVRQWSQRKIKFKTSKQMLIGLTLQNQQHYLDFELILKLLKSYDIDSEQKDFIFKNYADAFMEAIHIKMLYAKNLSDDEILLCLEYAKSVNRTLGHFDQSIPYSKLRDQLIQIRHLSKSKEPRIIYAVNSVKTALLLALKNNQINDRAVLMLAEKIATRNDLEYDNVLAEWGEKFWTSRDSQNKNWFNYVDWKSADRYERAKIYKKRIPDLLDIFALRLLDIKDKNNYVISQRIETIYIRFALITFSVGEYDSAEKLLNEVLDRKWVSSNYQIKKNHVISLYLLALCKQQQGNIPEALKNALDSLELLGDSTIERPFYLDYRSCSRIPNIYGDNNLKEQLTDLVRVLRTASNAKMVNPFMPRKNK